MIWQVHSRIAWCAAFFWYLDTRNFYYMGSVSPFLASVIQLDPDTVHLDLEKQIFPAASCSG